MNQFRSSFFKFDGVDSESYGYKMVEVGNTNTEVTLGLDRAINKTDNGTDLGVFMGVKDNYHSISIQIVKTEGNKILKLSQADLAFLNKWLFCNSYKTLEVENGLIYFAMFTKAIGKFNSGGDYITLSLDLLPTAYTPIRVMNQVVVGSKIIELTNTTTINETTPIDVHVSMITGSSFSITNLTTGKKFTMTGMVSNEEFYVYTESPRRFVESRIDGKRNLYKLCNRVFDLDLIYGKNKLKIECDKCEVEVIYQSKMSLQ